MKPNMVNGRVIIIICIVVLIILGVFWLLNNNNIGKEGYKDKEKAEAKAEARAEARKKAEAKAKARDKARAEAKAKAKNSPMSKIATFGTGLISMIGTEFDKAGPDINGGKTFNDVKLAAPKVFEDMDKLIDGMERNGDDEDDIIINTDITGIIDTTTKPCKGKTFLSSKKFADSLSMNNKGNTAQLNAKCSQLTADSCNLTNSCVWVGGKTCMAGNINGPTVQVDDDGKDIDYAYYTYKSQCYGSCGTGTGYANPCSEFTDNQSGVNKKCISRLWGQTKCPNTRYVTDDVVKELKTYSKEGITTLFKKAKDEENYANCYGPNEHDWPKPCAAYPKDTNANISVRCLTKLYNDTDCDQTENIITPAFAVTNKLKTKGEMITEFDRYYQGVDGSGNADSDYTKCYGSDQEGWPEPCLGTSDLTDNLTKRCLTRLHKDVGCKAAGASFLLTPKYMLDNKTNVKTEMIQKFKGVQYKSSDNSFMQCYGPDRSTWPTRSMILGIGLDYKIYYKRERPGILIENAPWELDANPTQLPMISITQLENGWLYGVGIDTKIYLKRYLGDPWLLDPLWAGAFGFRLVRQLNDQMKQLLGVHNNKSVYSIDRTPDKPKMEIIEKSCCCLDVLDVPNQKWPIAVIGPNGLVHRRQMVSQYGKHFRMNDGKILNFINIPNGKPDGGNKVLALGMNRLLYVKNFIDESGWGRGWRGVSMNNNIPMLNISFITLNNKTPAISTEPAQWSFPGL